MKITFDELPIGKYTEEMWRSQWPNVTNPRGIAEGRLSIEKIDSAHVLCVTCQKGKWGPDAGGTSWGARFDKTYEEATVEYQVMVGNDFNFKRGGKLPGFCGGSSPMGGKNTDGFSARVMWRELGMLEQYVYYMDKPEEKKYGSDFIWTTADDKQVLITTKMWKMLNTHRDDWVYMKPGVWHAIKTYVKMNTQNQEDGKIISWLNGDKICDLTLRFRRDDSFGIDLFRFSVFFGGNDETWAPDKDEKIYFKNFLFQF